MSKSSSVNELSACPVTELPTHRNATDSAPQSVTGQLPGTNVDAQKTSRHQENSALPPTETVARQRPRPSDHPPADRASSQIEQTPLPLRTVTEAVETTESSLRGRARLKSVAKGGGYAATLGAIVGGTIGTLVAGPLGTVVGVAAGAVVFGLIGMGCSCAVSCWRDSQSARAGRFVERLREHDLSRIAQMELNDPDLTPTDQEMIREALRATSEHDLSTHHEFLSRSTAPPGWFVRRTLTIWYLKHHVVEALKRMKSFDAGKMTKQEQAEMLASDEQRVCRAGACLFEELLKPQQPHPTMHDSLIPLLTFVGKARQCTQLRWSMLGKASEEIPQEEYDRDRDRLIAKAWSESVKRLKPSERNRIFNALQEDSNLRVIWEYAATLPAQASNAHPASMPAREIASLIRQIVLSVPTGGASGADTLCCTEHGSHYGRTLGEIVESLERAWTTQDAEKASKDPHHPHNTPFDQAPANRITRGQLRQRHHGDFASRVRLNKAAADVLNYLSFIQGLDVVYQLYRKSRPTRDQHHQRREAPAPVVSETNDSSLLRAPRSTKVSAHPVKLNPGKQLQVVRNEWEQFLVERAKREVQQTDGVTPKILDFNILDVDFGDMSLTSSNDAALTIARAKTI